MKYFIAVLLLLLLCIISIRASTTSSSTIHKGTYENEPLVGVNTLSIVKLDFAFFSS